MENKCEFCGRKLSNKYKLKSHYKSCKKFDFVEAYCHIKYELVQKSKEIEKLKQIVDNNQIDENSKSSTIINGDVHININNNYFQPTININMMALDTALQLLEVGGVEMTIEPANAIYKNLDYPENNDLIKFLSMKNGYIVKINGDSKKRIESDIHETIVNNVGNLYNLHELREKYKPPINNHLKMNIDMLFMDS